MKKLLAFVLCLAMLLGTCSTAYAISFSDVPEGVYYYEPVYNIAWYQIIGGFPDGTFGPGRPITREQMAVMLVNMQKLSLESPATPCFPDVPSSRWSYKYVETAAQAGFINGYPDGTFRPDKNVSYDEAITMIVALMGYTLKDLGGTYPTAFTNKARDLGILNTCAMLGSNAATRANVSCFLRDALLSFYGDPDLFKFKGSNYNMMLGDDYTYTVTRENSKTEGYGVTLFIENKSSSPIPYSATSFTAVIDGRTYLIDTASYDAFDDYSVPNGTIGAGQTAKVSLFFACGSGMKKGTIYPNLSNGSEAEIELEFQ